MIGRIVIVNDLSHAMGGASALAIQAAKGLARRGYPVTFICGSAGNSDLETEGIEVLALGQERLLAANPVTTFVRGIYNRQAAAMVSQWIADNDTPHTVYHVHGWSQILSPSLFGALAPVHDRTLVHAHDFFATCPNGAMFDYGKSAPCPAKPMSVACMTTGCDRRGPASKVWRVARQAVQDRTLRHKRLPLLLIHGNMAPYFQRSGYRPEEMAVLPNPVVPFTTERVAAEYNHEVLFVGRMEATKGIDLAARACRHAGVRLMAIGTGDLLGTLCEAYPEMAWLGHKPSGEIPAFARRARMAVMPSRHIEPFGLAAVEALWSGIPVLSSRSSLIAPDIEAAGAGRSIDPRNTEEFAAAIAAIAHDDAGARRMSHNAATRTGGLALTPEKWIDALAAAYEGLLLGGNEGLADAALSWAAGSPGNGAEAAMPAARAATSPSLAH
ncbi:glycosyltransferase family 4 protein [Novosphingobium beihaiensis]|uniref:Glycosyltransferase family 4 protein n=1 Tax=Novosphingobium beihaiensis TaxID=2930389 RepID=A0ABT0BTN3_9SPHN|nr:glycosyltransferase family 4 protein [Novosphingobium beihaiensis]MCJ2188387.1 glycosyltransferase family 4 protein [Novosphingobium beihaiensis]